MQTNGLESQDSCTKTELTDCIIIITLSAMSFLPMIGNGNIFRLILMVCLLGLQIASGRFTLDKSVKRILIMMLASALIPFVVVMAFEGSVNIGFWIHEFIRILFYCMLIPVAYNSRVNHSFLFKVVIVVLVVNLAIQFMQWRHIAGINQWIYQYYAPKDQKFTHLMLAEYLGAGFRAGSVFLNPNVCMVIPCTVLAVLIQRNSLFPSLLHYIWIGLVVFSVLLTGSRTAFILTMTVVGYCTWKDKNAGKIKWLLPVVLLIGLWMNISSLENFRAVNLETAMEGSGYTKINGILAYVTYANPVYLVTGCCGSCVVFGLDSEWGYVFMFYGILGLVWYISFLKLFQRNRRGYPVQTLAVTLVICLIACTASVFFCMPVCSFFCAVALPQFLEQV